MVIDLAQFVAAFIEESIEGLDVIESALVGVDTQALDIDTINVIFRAAHSIKGGAGTFGLGEISQFTHVAETLLDQIRSGQRTFEQYYVDLLLQSVDCLREMFACIQSKKPIEVPRAAKIVEDFEKVLAAKETAVVAKKSEIESKEWEITFKPPKDLYQTGSDPIRLFRQLEFLGKVSVSVDASQLPSFDKVDPLDCYLVWNIHLQAT